MPFLIALTGPYTGEAFEVENGRTTVGRGPACGIQLTQDAAVSRAHALLEAAGIALKVEDAGSTHGVYVNGRRVQQAVLHSGDCVQFGGSTFQLSPIPRIMGEKPRLHMVVARTAYAGGGPPEKVIAPALGCLFLVIALLLPIPCGLQIAVGYMRKNDPANQRFGIICAVASLVSTALQVWAALHFLPPMIALIKRLTGGDGLLNPQ